MRDEPVSAPETKKVATTDDTIRVRIPAGLRREVAPDMARPTYDLVGDPESARQFVAALLLAAGEREDARQVLAVALRDASRAGKWLTHEIMLAQGGPDEARAMVLLSRKAIAWYGDVELMLAASAPDIYRRHAHPEFDLETPTLKGLLEITRRDMRRLKAIRREVALHSLAHRSRVFLERVGL